VVASPVMLLIRGRSRNGGKCTTKQLVHPISCQTRTKSNKTDSMTIDSGDHEPDQTANKYVNPFHRQLDPLFYISPIATASSCSQ